MSGLAPLLRDALTEGRRAPLTWGGALGAMGVLLVAIWPSIGDAVGDLAQSYPSEVLQAFGIRSLSTVESYLDAELMSLVAPLALAFLAVRMVARPTVSAEEHGYLATVLVLPVRRRAVAWAAFLSATLVVAGALVVFWAMTMLTSVVAGVGVDAWAFGRGVLMVWALATAFAGLATLAAGLTRGSARVSEVAIGVLVGMYVLDLAGKLSPDLHDVRAISAFRWYGSAIQDGLQAGHLLILLVAGLLLAAAGAEALERRDAG